MKDCLRYPLSDRLYVEATLDNNKGHENFKVIVLRLYFEDQHAVIAKKKFLWPEQTLPKEATMDDENGVLILKGTGNIAKVSINIRPEKCSLFVGTSEESAPAVPVFASLSLGAEAESVSSLATEISSCLAQEDLGTTWTHLSKLARKGNALDHLPLTVSTHEQVALIKVLRKHIDDKSFDRVVSFLIHSRLISSPRASCKLMTLLANESLIPQAVSFVRSSLILDDQTYTVCLKLLANGSKTGKLSLLLALLEKPINNNGLHQAISQSLTEAEVTALIEQLISLSCDRKGDYSFEKILKLVAALIDSHAQRFIWDEKCHRTIQNAACSITDVARLIDLFRHLERQLILKKKTAEDVPELYSDYIIRRISFVQKPI